MHDQNILVAIRCRPSFDDEKSIVHVSKLDREIKLYDKIEGAPKSFHCDYVFDQETGQKEVYKTVVRPLLNHVLLGYNCTVFAYGQTGTGKTYTMEGIKPEADENWEEDPECGVIPRAVSQLFETLRTQGNKFTIRVSFLELYNEDVYDLLSPVDDHTKLSIFQDNQKKGSVIVGGLSEETVQSKFDIYDILRRGSLKRRTAATTINACSSRSHTIFNITAEMHGSSDGFRQGKLKLVDLAGSESIGRSGAQDIRAREAGSINQSLLTLGRVITSLVEGSAHIPFRESKLTRILQDSLGGATRTSIIATISPAETDLANTLSTLEYATRARKITNRPEAVRSFKRNNPDFEHEIQILKEKHQTEMAEQEYKVRNEVAQEYRREIARMKESFDEQLKVHKVKFNETEKSRKALEDENEKVRDENQKLKDEIKDLQQKVREMSDMNRDSDSKVNQNEREKRLLLEQLREYETKYDKLEAENGKLATENVKLLEKNAELLQKKSQPAKTSRKTVVEMKHEDFATSPVSTKREETPEKKAPEECDYANMTFDGHDELIPQSIKKSRKKIENGAKKRTINPAITLSGKKRKLANPAEDDELSPIPVVTGRVTRSRAATRKKLEF